MAKRTVLEERIVDRFRMWQLLWEQQEIGIPAHKNHIKWFVENNYVKTRVFKGTTLYMPNKKHRYVRLMMDLLRVTLGEGIKEMERKGEIPKQ